VTQVDKKNLLQKKFTTLRPGFGSGTGIGFKSAFVKKAGSGSAYNECGSEIQLKSNFSRVILKKRNIEDLTLDPMQLISQNICGSLSISL
jgi:hypothetical protein